MLYLNEKQQRRPFGGHHFHAYGTTLKGETFNEVEEKLRNFRVTNSLPVGDPAQEILAYYLEHWPWMVRVDDQPPAPNQGDYYDKWRTWVYKTWKNPPRKIITRKEASDRWKDCENCPFNKKKDWKETQESSEITRRAFLLRRGMEVPSYLGFCSLHNADIAAYSFIDAVNDFTARDKEHSIPSHCWAK